MTPAFRRTLQHVLSACVAALAFGACTPAREAAVPNAPPVLPGPKDAEAAVRRADLSIAERLQVFTPDALLHTAGAWDIFSGAAWPTGTRVLGLYLRAEARFQYLMPGPGVVASTRGDVVTMGNPSYLLARGAREALRLGADLAGALFSPDGARLLTLEHSEWALRDSATGAVLARRPGDDLRAPELVAWDSNIIIVSGGRRGSAVMEGRGYTVLDAASLAPIVDDVSGPLAPDHAFIADLARSGSHIRLRILATDTGREVRALDTYLPGRAGERYQVDFSPDARRFWWYADGLHILDLQSGREKVADHSVAPSPHDAESQSAAAPTENGLLACFTMDGENATFDLVANRVLVDRPGHALRCAIHDHVAHVARVPLAADERVIRSMFRAGSAPEFVLSSDHTRAAVLVTKTPPNPDGGAALELLIIDLGHEHVLYRAVLGYAINWIFELRLAATLDGSAADVAFDVLGGRKSVRVDFATGRVTGDPPPEFVESPARVALPARFAGERPATALAGSTLLLMTTDGATALRLEDPSAALSWTSTGCERALSPQGKRVLEVCDAPAAAKRVAASGIAEMTRSATVRSTSDGTHSAELEVPPNLTAFAVADDGSVAFAALQDLWLVAEGRSRRISLPRVEAGGGSARRARDWSDSCQHGVCALTWSPDGKLLAAWSADYGQIDLLDRNGDVPRWSRPRPEKPERFAFSSDGRNLTMHPSAEAFAVSDATRFDLAEGDHSERTYQVDPRHGAFGSEMLWGGSDLTSVNVLAPLATVRPPANSIVGGAILAAGAEGRVRVHDLASGAVLATLIPLRTGRIVALFADGRVDWRGDAAHAAGDPTVLCTLGRDVVPVDRCAPLEEPLALARALAAPHVTP